MNEIVSTGYDLIMKSSTSLKNIALAMGLAIGQVPLQTSAQATPISELTTTFNSSFSLTKAQISDANLTKGMVDNINLMMRVQQSQMANGGPEEDDFYNLPPIDDPSALEPGQVLKVQAVTDPYSFGTAPGSTLSRFIYVSETVNETLVPASAYVLWPFQNRQFPDSTGAAPAVLFSHGTSGFFPNYAPSTDRALQYGDMFPFNLAQAGYAVVAPDYAGLGVGKSWDGSEVEHQYFVGPSGARDTVLAMQAARSAFKGRLEKKYVVAGHSQGGGVAWATAEYVRTLQDNIDTLDKGLREVVEGYLGTIAMAPVTNGWSAGSFVAVYIATIMDTVFPDFKLEQWLTPLGIARTKLYRQIQGSVVVLNQLISDTSDGLLHPNWYNGSYYGPAFGKLGNPGRKPFAGPMLVTQGTKDVYVSEAVTAQSVKETCKKNPNESLEYVVVDGYGHTPAVSALRFTWMNWLEDRFHGKQVKDGCSKTHFASVNGSAQHGSSYPQWAGAAEYNWMNVGYL